jgi:hypothetical protein
MHKIFWIQNNYKILSTISSGLTLPPFNKGALNMFLATLSKSVTKTSSYIN